MHKIKSILKLSKHASLLLCLLLIGRLVAPLSSAAQFQANQETLKLLNMAYAEFKKGNHVKVIEYSTRCIQKEPKYAQSYSYRANSYEALGDKAQGEKQMQYLKKALSDYEKYVDLMPNKADGRVGTAKRRIETLRERLQELEPPSEGAKKLVERAQEALNKYNDCQKAINLCSQAIAADSTYAPAYFYRARCSEKIDRDSACQDYKTFLEKADATDPDRTLAEQKIKDLCGAAPPTPIVMPPTPSVTCPPPLALLQSQNVAARSLNTKHENPARALAFSADGKWLASGSFAKRSPQSDSPIADVGDIKIWNVANARLQVQIYGHREGDWRNPKWIGHWGKINALAFAPHRSLLASGGQDGDIVLWDPQTGAQLRRLSEFKGRPIVDMAFSCDGSRFFAGTRDGAVRLWDTTNWNSGDEMKTGHPDDVIAYAFSPDGRFIASRGRSSANIWQWSPRTVNTLETPLYQPRGIAFLRDGSLAIGRKDSVNFYLPDKTNAGNWPLEGLALHYQSRMAEILAAAPDARTIAIGRDAAIALWDRIAGRDKTSDILLRVPGANSDVMALAFSPQGWPLAATYEDGTVLLWQ